MKYLASFLFSVIVLSLTGTAYAEEGDNAPQQPQPGQEQNRQNGSTSGNQSEDCD